MRLEGKTAIVIGAGQGPPHRESRAVVMEMMYRYGKISQEEIGKRFGGLDYSAVSRERTRLRERLDGDRKLQRTMKEIDNIIKSKVKNLTL